MALAHESGEHGRHVVKENPDGRGPFVILCDHASSFFPADYDGLGLTEDQKRSHIAWDPGALQVARRMSDRLDAPLLWPGISRLIVDCNRSHDAPDLIPESGEGEPVPGNAALSPDERRERIERYHAPYHLAIDELLNLRAERGQANALVAVHSYTPVFFGQSRPWPIGIIFDKDRNLADHVIADLKTDLNLNIGVNEPYSPADGVYHTLSTHGDRRALPSVMIEIRSDEISSDKECVYWADRLSNILASVDLQGLTHA